MKKPLLFILLISFISYGQNKKGCEEANSYVIMAYSYVKKSYEANNIDHLKEFAYRALQSYKKSKPSVSTCNCKAVIELIDKNIDLLAKVEEQPTYEDTRFLIKQSKEKGQESMIEMDKCTIGHTTEYEAPTETIDHTSLSELELEQLNLQQQQEALKKQQEALKNKLAEQKEKELELKKDLAISNYNSTIDKQVKTYNETLKNIGCKGSISAPVQPNSLSTENLDTIKDYYLNALIDLTSDYSAQLKLFREDHLLTSK